MSADKLVSVIIPVYNASAHLERTLTSIIAQDYGSLEIIIVNDASTDSSLEIAHNVLSGSARPHRIITLPQNLGVSYARNTGLKAARGEYVWFCDADDLVDERFLRVLCGEAKGKNADIVFCGMTHYYEDSGKFVDEKVNAVNMTSPEEYFGAWADDRLYLWSVWNFIFRRDFLRKSNLCFSEGCIYGEDAEFVMKAVALASRISFVRDILYTYIHHKSQTIAKRKEPAMMHSLLLARFRMWRFVLRHTTRRSVKNYVLNFCLPDMLVNKFTLCAKAGDRERYLRFTRCLKHKKVREILLSSVRFIAKKPELFFKSLALAYAPKLYYVLRKG